MESTKLAEKELQELLAKYSNLEFIIVPQYKIGFKVKESVKTEVEVVEPTTTTDVAPETIDIDSTVSPVNPQPEA